VLILLELPPRWHKYLKRAGGALHFPLLDKGRYVHHVRARIVSDEVADRLRPYLQDDFPTLLEGQTVTWEDPESGMSCTGLVIGQRPATGTVVVETDVGEQIIARNLVATGG
jgi:hypothetical protein